MDNFLEKYKHYEETRVGLDNHIWEIFRRYLEENNILFSDPEYWIAHEDYVEFIGKDGCRGCYDNYRLCIPLYFFENPDKQFARLALLEKERKQKELENMNEELKRKELELLADLKAKYENG